MKDTKQFKTASSPYLAVNIRFLRKRKKLSQEELGQLTGLNRGNIASYENGSAEPKICNMLKLAEFFSIPLHIFARHDLTNEEQLTSISRIQGLCPQERAKLEELHLRALEFDQFLEGIHTCFQYKSKNLDQIENLPKEALFLKSHFEQLHEAAKTLSEEHKTLLNMCRTKN